MKYAVAIRHLRESLRRERSHLRAFEGHIREETALRGKSPRVVTALGIAALFDWLRAPETSETEDAAFFQYLRDVRRARWVSPSTPSCTESQVPPTHASLQERCCSRWPHDLPPYGEAGPGCKAMGERPEPVAVPGLPYSTPSSEIVPTEAER